MDATIYKNSIILILLRLVEPLFSLVVITAISRSMGPAILGSYSFLLTFTGMISVIGQLGLSPLLTRDVAKHRDQAAAFLNSAVVIGCCASVPMIIVMNCSGRFFHLTSEVSFCVFLISLSVLPGLVTSAFEAIFMAFEKTELILYRRMAASIFRLISVLAAVWMHAPLHYIVLIDVCNSALSVIICASVFNKNIATIQYRIVWGDVVDLLKNSPAFFGVTVLTVLAARSDVLLLTRFSNMREVALYTVAVKLYEMNMVLPQAYIRAAFPRFSKLYHTSISAFQPVARRIFVHMTIYGVLSAGFMVTAGPLVLRVLFGEKFAASFNVLRVLSLGIIPYVFGRVLSSALTAGNQQRFDLLAAVCATAANLGLNVLLIPHYGSLGSAMAACCSGTLGCVIITAFTTRVLDWSFLSRALKWGVGIGAAAIFLCSLAMFHEILALGMFLVLFAVAGCFYLMQNNRWKQLLSNSASVYRDLVSP